MFSFAFSAQHLVLTSSTEKLCILSVHTMHAYIEGVSVYMYVNLGCVFMIAD